MLAALNVVSQLSVQNSQPSQLLETAQGNERERGRDGYALSGDFLLMRQVLRAQLAQFVKAHEP